MLELLGIVLILSVVTCATALVAFATLALHPSAPGSDCPRCDVEAELVDESLRDLGCGWLQGERTYVCPLCQGISRQSYVAGPADYLSAP